MKAAFLILAIIFLAGHAIRTTYELLKDAGRINPENKILFGAIFGVMCLLWVCWFSMCPLDPYHIGLPDMVRYAGLALFLIGLILAVGALVQLRGVENIDHLVTTGLFAKLRHPMYLGFICWIFGWSVYHDAVASFLVGVPGIVNILYWRQLEERRLIAEYGERYTSYLRRTWF